MNLSKTTRKRISLVAFSTLLITALVLSIIPARAVDPSFWMGTEQPTLTIEEDPAQPVLRPINEFCEDTTFRVWMKEGGVNTLKDQQDCALQTDYGLLSRNYLQFARSSEALKLEVANGFGSVFLVPKTDQLFYTTVSGGFKFLFSYNNPASKITKQTGNSTYPFMYKSSASPDWRFADQNNQLIMTRQMAASKNGQWMLIEVAGGIVRLNLTTKEFFKFTTSVPPYGVGLNPTLHMAISNDGRYAAVGGVNYSGMKIYDLSTCNVPPFTGSTALVSGCGERDMTSFLQTNIPGYNSRSFYLEFSSDAAELTARHGRTNQQGVKAKMTSAHYAVNQLDYLALGDSFSSGEGEVLSQRALYYLPGTFGDAPPEPGVDTSLEKCHISTRSYPYLLRQQMDISTERFHSIACAAALKEDMDNVSNDTYSGQFEQLPIEALRPGIKLRAVNNFTPGREAQLAFVEKYKPRVITMTMGGNNLDFGGKLKECIMNIGTCKYADDDPARSAMGRDIKNQFGPLKDLYTSLKAASPTSKIYVLGYPKFFEEGADCSVSDNVSLNSTERDFVHQSIMYFNDVIEAAASAAGVTYIDVEDSLAGNQLCSGAGTSTAFNGIEAGLDSFPFISNGSFHPNPNGHSMMAATVQQKVGNLLTYTCEPNCPAPATSAPGIPLYFLIDGEVLSIPKQEPLTPKERLQKDIDMIIDVRASNFTPGTNVRFELQSDPVDLGAATVNAQGEIVTALTIPDSVPAGYHTLHVFTTTPSGEQLDLYQPIVVLGREGDLDEDGVPDADDKCGFVPAANVDYDRDGIDDACDGFIDEPAADSTAPTVTGTPDREPNQNGWYNNDVTINWAATDPDPSSGTPTTPPATLADQEGDNTYISEPACDPLNNCATGSVNVKLDKTAPTITYSVDPVASADWHTSTATITFDCADALSGVASCSEPQSVTEDGSHVVTGTVTDYAGNAASVNVTVQLDKTTPVLDAPTWINNPKSVSSSATLQLNATETTSGIAEAEYYLGDTDPGQGNGADMVVNGNMLSVSFGSDFPTGVYKVTMRTKDNAGNWSTDISDYLVVYSPAGTRMTGKRVIIPSLASGDSLPGLIDTAQTDKAKFGFNVRYDQNGQLHPNSDLQFRYNTGAKCNQPAKAVNCHNFELNATSIAWLTTQGQNNSTGIFQGTAQLEVDGVVSTVLFRLTGLDGELLNPTSQDYLTVKVYNQSDNPNTAAPIYQASGEVERGNIKVHAL